MRSETALTRLALPAGLNNRSNFPMNVDRLPSIAELQRKCRLTEAAGAMSDGGSGIVVAAVAYNM